MCKHCKKAIKDECAFLKTRSRGIKVGKATIGSEILEVALIINGTSAPALHIDRSVADNDGYILDDNLRIVMEIKYCPFCGDKLITDDN